MLLAEIQIVTTSVNPFGTHARLTDILAPYSYIALAFPRAIGRTCGFRMLISFPGMDLVLFPGISVCCRATPDITRRSRYCSRESIRSPVSSAISLMILKLRDTYCVCFFNALRKSRVFRFLFFMNRRNSLRALFRYVRGFLPEGTAFSCIMSMAFSVFCRASSSRVTSCG